MDWVKCEKRRQRSAVCLAGFVIILVAGPLESVALTGVVVEKLQPDGAAEQAGLQPDDVLLSWTQAKLGARSGDCGDLVTILDWIRVEAEKVPLGGVEFDLLRGEQERLTVRPQSGRLGIEVRPQMTGSALDAYEMTRKGLDWASQGDGGFPGVQGWRTLAGDMERTGEWHIAWWLEVRAGEAFAGGQLWDEAEDCLTHAVELTKQAQNTFAEALTRRELGDLFRKRNQIEAARAQYGQAEAALRSEPDETVTLALVLGRRGLLSQRQGAMDEAAQLHGEELEILNRLAPQSLEVAASLHSLGSVAHQCDRFAEAQQLYLQALAIRQKLAPDSILVGFTSNNLGLLARLQGDLEAADRYLRQALELKERARPNSVTVAHTFNNVGLVATARGRLETAEGHFRHALGLYRRLVPDSRYVGTALNNLAEVQILRHRWSDAQSLLEQALAIHEQAGPDSVSAARTMGNLGYVFSELEDLDAARHNYQRALKVFAAQAPGGIDVAKIENNLGEIAWRRDDLEQAHAFYCASLEKKRRLAPGSLLVADMLATYAGLQRELGNAHAVEGFLREALAIAGTLAPGSATEARILHLLGVLRRDRGDQKTALDCFRRAIDALEAQIGRLGGSGEARAGYRAAHMGYYHDLIELLLDSGQGAEAFHVLERSRAQVLLAMLAERDIVFSADVPAELDRERRLNGVAYDRAQQQLAELSLNDIDEIGVVTEKLRELRRQREEIWERTRRSSPRLAALAYPEVLDLAAAYRAVDPGTTVLSYSVGKDHTYLFVLDSSGGLRVKTIDLAENDLHDCVSLFRGLIEGGTGSPEKQRLLIEAGRRLYSRLVAPVEDSVSTAERLLIVPDGVLHLLPFSALVRDTQEGAQYLVEWKPVTTVVSLTVFSEIQAGRSLNQGTVVVAFADPVYRGRALTSLPGSRAEAEAIAELYGEATTIWLGPQATETRSKQLSRDTMLVHFAAHVELDERFPLDSAIALSVPTDNEAENGFLQAWEVFESVRVDADLVTLSGCHTALGKQVGGEGLIGLTRAFQYAGARTVLASLWRVEDRTTAEFMRRFYGFLRAGQNKDQALRLAQLELIRGPIVAPDRGGGLMASFGSWVRGLVGAEEGHQVDASHPFFWAAFKLEGDWQ